MMINEFKIYRLSIFKIFISMVGDCFVDNMVHVMTREF
jgi:hypothetical protein